MEDTIKEIYKESYTYKITVLNSSGKVIRVFNDAYITNTGNNYIKWSNKKTDKTIKYVKGINQSFLVEQV